MKSLRLLPLLLVLVLGFPLPTPTHAQSDAPYIYYYSDLLKGWVIERADGTDGRVIGQGLVGDLNIYEDVSWSPSGKWMSWLSPTGPVLAAGGAVRMDGSKIVTHLTIASDEAAKRATGLRNVAWSPIEDLLLGHNIIWNSPRMIGRLAIIDPETDTIIAQTTVEETFFEYYGGQSGWLQDGSGVYLTSPGAVTILYKTGEVKTSNYSSYIARGAYIANGYAIGVMSLFNQYSIAIENLATNRFISALELGNQLDVRFQLFWNPSKTHLLLLTWNCEQEWGCLDNPRQLYLVELATEKTTFLGGGYRDIGITGMGGIPMIGNHNDNTSQMWSTDGSRAIFLDQYKREDADLQLFGRLRLVDITTATTTLLPHLDDIYSWQWIGNDALLVRRIDDEIPYRYDLNTFEVESLGAFRPEYTWYQLSPSGRYLGGDYYDANRIVDLQTGDNIEWIPYGHPCVREVDYLWNADESWFFTGQLAYCMDGPWYDFGGISIHSTDETTNRELTMCSEVGTCAGFLPERAIPHLSEAQTESVLLQPEAILHHSEDGVAVVGWSPDGHTLVTTAKEDASLVYFWDLTSTPRLISTQETRVDCLVCEGKWTPDGRYLSLFGLTIGEVWDSQNARLVQRLLIAPPRPYWQEMGYGVANTQCRRLLPGQIEGSVLTTQIQGQQFQVDLNYVHCSRNGEWMLAESNRQLLALQPDQFNTLPVGDDRPEGQIITDYLPNSPVLIATTPRSIYGKTHMSLLDRELGQWLTVPINFFTSNAALSPDGRWIAAAGAQTVTIWDIAQIRARQVVE